MKNSANKLENFKWGEIKPEKLVKDIDAKRLCEARSMLIDEPLFSNALTPDLIKCEVKFHNHNYDPLKQQDLLIKKDTKNDQRRECSSSFDDKETQMSLQPTIDSYIINTIKLNKILNSGLTFDQIEYFTNKNKTKSQNNNKNVNKNIHVNTDIDARYYLKQFITVMSMHSGFDVATASSFDILVDLLELYILSFFKVLKNLKNIHQTDLNTNEHESSLIQTDYYSSNLFIKQVLLELGVGTIQDIKNFYINDIIDYHQQVFKKVSQLYDEFKSRKTAERASKSECEQQNIKVDGEIKLEEFIKENDFLNDEGNSLFGELLTNLNESHFDDEMNKLLQIIGDDPFSLITEEFRQNMEKI